MTRYRTWRHQKAAFKCAVICFVLFLFFFLFCFVFAWEEINPSTDVLKWTNNAYKSWLLKLKKRLYFFSLEKSTCVEFSYVKTFFSIISQFTGKLTREMLSFFANKSAKLYLSNFSPAERTQKWKYSKCQYSSHFCKVFPLNYINLCSMLCKYSRYSRKVWVQTSQDWE